MKLHITIFLSNRCNYMCYYCNNAITYFNNTILDIQKCIKFINRLGKQYDAVIIEFGGNNEPTLYINELIELITNFNINIETIIVQTNLSQNINVYKKLLNYSNIKIIATWHSLPTDAFNCSFLSKINNFSNIDNIVARVMLEDKHINAALMVYNKITIHKELMLLFNTKYKLKDINRIKYFLTQYKPTDFIQEKQTIYIDEKQFFNKAKNNLDYNDLTICYDGKIVKSDFDVYEQSKYFIDTI